MFFGEFLQGGGGRTGNFFRELEKIMILALAKILGTEQFLGANNLGSGPGGTLHQAEGFL
jgi:hypothetical protein